MQIKNLQEYLQKGLKSVIIPTEKGFKWTLPNRDVLCPRHFNSPRETHDAFVKVALAIKEIDTRDVP